MARPLALLATLFVAASCSNSNKNPTTPCKTNADCPQNATCDTANGQCYGQVQNNTGANGGTTQSAGSGSTTASTSAGTTGNGGNAGNSGTGTTGNGTGTTGNSNGGTSTGGGLYPGCNCNAACCSQIAGGGITCPDGTFCSGQDNQGNPYYCDFQSGGCDDGDPCNGNSGYGTCQSTGTTTTGGSGTGGSCGCSTSCCSQIAGSGLVCPDGKMCWGTTDAGAAFYCNYQTGKCDPFDPCNGNSGVYTDCGATGGGTSNGGSTGGTGTTTGGTVSILPNGLVFAVIGDTRPPSPCSSISDCSPGGSDAYPTQIITAIYSDLAALPTPPQYILGTGDYMDNSPGNGTADYQIQQYLSAVGSFSSVTFPAMGNHECNGTPSSDCGPNGSDGITENYTSFLGMLSSLGITSNNGLAYYMQGPYTLATGQTVKFIMLAANAWDSTQKTWFDTALSTTTDYTFVSRHEPDDAVGLSTWNGIVDSDAVMANHPGGVTLRLEGHTHELRWSWGTAGPDGGAGEAIVGNGGANPWDCTSTTNTIYCDYGYLLCQQRTDNSILCTPYAEAGNVPAPSPAPFAVFANGAQDGW